MNIRECLKIFPFVIFPDMKIKVEINYVSFSGNNIIEMYKYQGGYRIFSPGLRGGVVNVRNDLFFAADTSEETN